MKFIDYLLYGVIFFEALCAIFATLNFDKYKHSNARVLCHYLWIVWIVDLTGTIVYIKGLNNLIFYNLLGIVEFGTFAFIFYKELHHKITRKLIFTLSFGFLISILVESFYSTNPISGYLSYSFALGSLSLVVFSCLYLYHLAQTERIIQMYDELLTWICLGLLFYHLCSLPITIISNSMVALNINYNLLSILAISSIIMYILFILGFKWSKKTKSSY